MPQDGAGRIQHTATLFADDLCAKDDKVERFDFRAGGYYEGIETVARQKTI